MPSTGDSNNSVESMMPAPPINPWPLSDNRFNDIDGWGGFNERYFEEAGSFTDERTSIIRSSSTEGVLMDDNLTVRQSKQFSRATMAPSSLSSNSLNNSVPGESHNPDTVGKSKSRRRLAKTITVGSNPHGRNGKLRCELCRSRRQGVSSG
jgi:hypothetical protein